MRYIQVVRMTWMRLRRMDERSQKAFALCHKPETIIMVYDLSL